MTTFFIDGEALYWPDGPGGPFVPLAEADALDARIAAQEDALGSCREAFEGLEAERDGLRALVQRIIALENSAGLHDRHTEKQGLKTPKLQKLLVDCRLAVGLPPNDEDFMDM